MKNSKNKIILLIVIAAIICLTIGYTLHKNKKRKLHRNSRGTPKFIFQI